MSFFAPREPSLDELITYVVGRAIDREAALTKTKLTKLLYLIDVETWRAERRSLTELEWVFLHYGPYATALDPSLNQLEGQQLHWKELPRGNFERTIIYTHVSPIPTGETWPAITKLRVDSLVDRWAHEPLELLLDYVYFETEPMRGANRGERLDFSSIMRHRAERALAPMRVNEDVRLSLRGALAEQRRLRAAVAALAPPRYDLVWEEAMSLEETLSQSPDLTGSMLVFDDEAAASFAAGAGERDD